MLNVKVIRGQKSGHSEYDYIMVSGQPEEIAELIESLSRQLAGYVRNGREGQRAEPRFEGTIFANGEDKGRLGGYFSIAIMPEMRCVHPDCREEFDVHKPAAAFRASGLVCEKHEHEARWVRPKKEAL